MYGTLILHDTDIRDWSVITGSVGGGGGGGATKREG